MAGLKDLAARLRMADGGDIKKMLPKDLRKALRIGRPPNEDPIPFLPPGRKPPPNRPPIRPPSIGKDNRIIKDSGLGGYLNAEQLRMFSNPPSRRDRAGEKTCLIYFNNKKIRLVLCLLQVAGAELRHQ